MLLGLAASTLFTMTGCPSNREPNVYGMPDRGLYEDTEDVDVTNNQVEDVYGPPEWFDGEEPDVIDNMPAPVYGPPEDFDE